MFGFYVFGTPTFGQGPGDTPPVPPTPPTPVVSTRAKGGPGEGRPLSYEEALRRQTQARIKQDDEELIRMLGQLMDHLDP